MIVPVNAGIQRRALLDCPLERFRRRLDSFIFKSDRKASLTAAELRNAFAISGSK
jgi:hypothetical protein